MIGFIDQHRCTFTDHFYKLWIIFRTILDPLKSLYDQKWQFLAPFGAISDHKIARYDVFGPVQVISDLLYLVGSLTTFLSHSKKFWTILGHYRSCWTVLLTLIKFRELLDHNWLKFWKRYFWIYYLRCHSGPEGSLNAFKMDPKSGCDWLCGEMRNSCITGNSSYHILVSRSLCKVGTITWSLATGQVQNIDSSEFLKLGIACKHIPQPDFESILKVFIDPSGPLWMWRKILTIN